MCHSHSVTTLLSYSIHPDSRGSADRHYCKILTQMASAPSADYKNPVAPLHPAKFESPSMHTMRPTVLIPAGFQLAVIILLAVIPVRLYYCDPQYARINLLFTTDHIRDCCPASYSYCNRCSSRYCSTIRQVELRGMLPVSIYPLLFCLEEGPLTDACIS